MKVYPQRLTTCLHKKWEFPVHHVPAAGVNKVTYKDINENRAYVMVVRESTLDYIKRLSVPSVCFTLSTWRGIGRNNVKTVKFRESLKALPHNGRYPYSGHADVAGLGGFVKSLNPGILFPFTQKCSTFFLKNR